MKLTVILCSAILLLAQCNELPSSYTSRISKNDISLDEPQVGEWLAEHEESGQTFGQYKRAIPVKPTSKKSIIYLKPIGAFSDLQEKEIELIREYLEIYFQLKTVVMPRVTDSEIPSNDRRMRDEGWEQIHAPYILDAVLKNNIPDSAIVVMGIAEKDLYPKPEWNFAFGLAYLKQRVGVSSLFRMQDKKLNMQNFGLSLTRILKISSHEIGHMFTIKHCTYAKCVMNGANHMQETDFSPMRACSRCQQKLQYSIGYDDEKRLQELIAFLDRNKIEKHSKMLTEDL